MNTRIIFNKGLKLPMGTMVKPSSFDIPVVEVKFQLVGVAEVILHHHDEIMRLITRRRVVQAELPVLQQVAVVGQEGDAVIHFERAFPLELEIADSVKRVSEVALLFQLTADFHRLPL